MTSVAHVSLLVQTVSNWRDTGKRGSGK